LQLGQGRQLLIECGIVPEVDLDEAPASRSDLDDLAPRDEPRREPDEPVDDSFFVDA
jgi:hypothetical protein